MTDDQDKKEQNGNTGKDNAEAKKNDTKILVIIIAVCAAVIVGTLIAVFLTQSRQTSAPVGETTAAEPPMRAKAWSS